MRGGNVMPDEGFAELPGPRMALRRFHPDDLAKFVAYRSSEQVAAFRAGTHHTRRIRATRLGQCPGIAVLAGQPVTVLSWRALGLPGCLPQEYSDDAVG
jgi:hypothetical protein